MLLADELFVELLGYLVRVDRCGSVCRGRWRRRRAGCMRVGWRVKKVSVIVVVEFDWFWFMCHDTAVEAGAEKKQTTKRRRA